MTPRTLIRLENLVIGFAATFAFFISGEPKWIFFAFILAPDIGMLGYLAGPKVGSWTYNMFHIYAWPVLIAVYAFAAGNGVALDIALIWAAHIGFDRALGYGLKYPTGFRDTDLGTIGKKGP